MKKHKQVNFEPLNSLKRTFINIQLLCSNFVDCEIFLKSNSTDIFSLYLHKVLLYKYHLTDFILNRVD